MFVFSNKYCFIFCKYHSNAFRVGKESFPLGREASGLQGMCNHYKGKDIPSEPQSLFLYMYYYNISFRYLV